MKVLQHAFISRKQCPLSPPFPSYVSTLFLSQSFWNLSDPASTVFQESYQALSHYHLYQHCWKCFSLYILELHSPFSWQHKMNERYLACDQLLFWQCIQVQCNQKFSFLSTYWVTVIRDNFKQEQSYDRCSRSCRGHCSVTWYLPLQHSPLLLLFCQFPIHPDTNSHLLYLS